MNVIYNYFYRYKPRKLHYRKCLLVLKVILVKGKIIANHTTSDGAVDYLMNTCFASRAAPVPPASRRPQRRREDGTGGYLIHLQCFFF